MPRDRQRVPRHTPPGRRAARRSTARSLAERRRQRGARGLDQVFGLLEHRLAGDAGAADLRDGVEQDARARCRSGRCGGSRATRPRGDGAGCAARPASRSGASDSTRILLEQVEDQPLDRRRRAQAPMQFGVRVRAGAAPGRRRRRGRMRSRRASSDGCRCGANSGSALAAPVQPAAAEVQVALAAQRADRRGAELLDPSAGGRAACASLIGLPPARAGATRPARGRSSAGSTRPRSAARPRRTC